MIARRPTLLIKLNIGGFHGYDWGRHNDDHHGDDSPPTYDISDIDTPTGRSDNRNYIIIIIDR